MCIRTTAKMLTLTSQIWLHTVYTFTGAFNKIFIFEKKKCLYTIMSIVVSHEIEFGVSNTIISISIHFEEILMWPDFSSNGMMEYFLLHLEIVIQMDTALHIFIQWLGFFNNLFCILVQIIKILLLLLLFTSVYLSFLFQLKSCKMKKMQQDQIMAPISR